MLVVRSEAIGFTLSLIRPVFGYSDLRRYLTTPGKLPEAIVLFPGVHPIGLRTYSANADNDPQGSPLVDLGSSPHMLY